MKLTRRQQTFIRNLLDLYQELQGPIHYSQLAERVGVSPFTAYDMLRLLEEKGYVRCEYVLADAKVQTGRSSVVFAPTEKAHKRMSEVSSLIPSGDWEAVKDAFLERVQSGDLHDYEVALDILARVPQEDCKVVRYCTEVVTVLMLRLWRLSNWQTLSIYVRAFVGKDKSSCENLSLLCGFSLGALAQQIKDEPAWREESLHHIRVYQREVLDMEEDMRIKLASNLHAVLEPLMITNS